MEQGTFEEIMIEQARIKNEILTREYEELLKDVARVINYERLASLNGCSYQYVRAVLNTNGDGKPFPMQWIPSLMAEKPVLFMEKIGAWQANHCGYKIEKANPLTPEQKLWYYEQIIKQKGLESLFLEK
jgi:hypothetical protein